MSELKLTNLKFARVKSAKQQDREAKFGSSKKTDAERAIEAKQYGGQKITDLKARVKQVMMATKRLFALDAALAKAGGGKAFQITFQNPENKNMPMTVTIGREELKQMQAKVLMSIQELSMYFTYAKKRAPKVDANGMVVKSKSFGLVYVGSSPAQFQAVNTSAASNPLVDYIARSGDFAGVRDALGKAAVARQAPNQDAVSLLAQGGFSRRKTLATLLRMAATGSQIAALSAGQNIGADGSIVFPTAAMKAAFGGQPSLYHYDGKTVDRTVKDGKTKEKSVKLPGDSKLSAFDSLALAPAKVVPKGRVGAGQPMPFNPEAIHLYDLGSIISLNAFDADAKKAAGLPNLAAAIAAFGASQKADEKVARATLERITLAADADVDALAAGLEKQRDDMPQYQAIKAAKAQAAKEKAAAKKAAAKSSGVASK
jgi:hypothetical protein